jgi:cytochrome c2
MRLKLTIATIIAMAGTSVVAGPVFDAAKNGDTDALVRLLDDGADVNEPNFMPPLQIAAFNGDVEVLSLLIDRGADLDATSTMLGTAMHAASQKGYAEPIEIMIEAGADPNSRNSNQFTPLMIASTHGHARAASALIDGAADVNAIGFGRTNGTGGLGNVNALHLARNFGHQHVVEILLQAGATPKPPLEVASLIEAADSNLGRELAKKKCDQCHKIESEAEVITASNQGLSLVGVFGRPIGSRDDFDYSDAMRQTNGVWAEELLYSFAVDAMLTIPGTRMRWHDGWKDEEVAHIVAYFKSVAE